jgi:putative redox protein
MADTDTRPLNDVDLEALGVLFEQAHSSDTPMPVELSTRLRWLGGLAVEGAGATFSAIGEDIDRSHHGFTTDLPTALAGTDTGMGPTEMLLAATSACVTTTLVELATSQGIRLDRVEADAATVLDARGVFGVEGVPVGPSVITLRLRIVGDGEPEQFEAMANAAVEASPTAHAVTQPTPIRVVVTR